MFRLCAAPVAVLSALALLVPGMASSKELKPKFGDIGGVYYTDVSEDREACRQAIKNKIALCRQNTNFESNTKNRKHPGCLPIFRQQAQSCVVHFRHQTSKCDLSGAARITDFTGFGCTATATVVEEGGGPGIAPMDRRMKTRTRVNLRAGPGTDHRVVGSLAAGQQVQATGRAGDWLRLALPGGGAAFVHGQFMVASAGSQAPAQQGRGTAAGLSPKCAGMAEGAKCWKETANRRGCHVWDNHLYRNQTVTWSGACSQGVGVGRGTQVWTRNGRSYELTGALVRGKRHGRWVARFANGDVFEGPSVDGERHGRWVERFANGDVFEGPYVDGKLHGRWVERFANGDVLEGPYLDGKRHGRWVERYANGEVFEGPYMDGKRHGRWVLRDANGHVLEGPYLDGKAHGRWVNRRTDGTCLVLHWSHGKPAGKSSEC